ncbi:PEPxxWA-CTERM sorting domain-containing protein [Sphingomonas nostoxanthinifaciens]|uniref:PEPxxWA-CTERM sorting domain-containing protein n=1 Tax=Sphingomonas nostoxanthinifaciens TaxID=2872652 RepID=UPI001CC1F5C4|nr:PEPxxWA-CTERM sorting domain-containing protein [Sphingomonas nostoxanthinifaciens]UAK24798.1 PEPxxWA-CTERM sorting domain-containing protein [Sphingomonas nostoxanthinifaciens]
MATEYVQNGNFSQTTATGSQQISSSDGKTQYLTGWTNTTDGSYPGYNFIVQGNDGTTAGGIANNTGGKLYFWGKTSDAAGAASNGFTNSASIGGSGGNYLAADGAYQTALVYQVITGLTVGQQYDLTFNWAGAQQHGYDGVTTDNWTAYFGTSTSSYQSYTTDTVTDANHGFTGWQAASTTFTATATTEILGFLAKGTPNGEPPFSLLDDVSLTNHVAAVPEPASWAMCVGGFGLLGGALRRRRPVASMA